MGNTITLGRFVNSVLNRLHKCSRLCLRLLAFTCKLDLVKCDEPTTDPLCPTEVVKRILKLPESKFLLAVDNTRYTKRGAFVNVFELGR